VRLLRALILLLGALPVSAHAQVFLASHARPEFTLGPVFVSATVKPSLGPVTVSVSWSLVVRPNRTLGEIAQDLDLLWPSEVSGATGDPNPELVSLVEGLGFKIKTQGRLRVFARNRRDMGTNAPPEPIGDASFVIFFREGVGLDRDRASTYIRIPWTTKFADPDWLMNLRFEVRDLVVPRQATWAERTFWGQRHEIALGFSDVGQLTLYPMYFARRDYVVRLARDFSMLLLNFEEAGHLKIEEVVPATANRRPSQTRAGTEVVSIPLLGSEGTTPQVLKVNFSYFSGRVAWRPILISMLFLGLGNLTGPLVMALVRRLSRVARAHVQIGRIAGRPGRETGVIVSRDVLASLVPGETTYEEVVRRCGSHAEERERLSGDLRTLVYRGQRVVPHRRRTFGWFATVARWDVEHHEVEIELESGRVRDVNAHVRRTQLTEPRPA
jgi:hypothetical protein